MLRGMVSGGCASNELECRMEVARSLTPSLISVAQRERASSRIVIGLVGSIRPCATQDCIRVRGTVTKSFEKLGDRGLEAWIE